MSTILFNTTSENFAKICRLVLIKDIMHLPYNPFSQSSKIFLQAVGLQVWTSFNCAVF